MGVKIKYAVNEVNLQDLVGMSVKDAVKHIRQTGVFSALPQNVTYLLNGGDTDSNEILEDGDELYLKKPAGEKGC